jgi:hypothetical protein
MSRREELTRVLADHLVLYGVDQRARCILCGWIGTAAAGEGERHLTEVLVPLVDRLCAVAAADALTHAAEAVHVQRFNADNDPTVRWPVGTAKAPELFYAGIVRARNTLRARAAALTETTKETDR